VIDTAHGRQKKLITPTKDVQFTLGADQDLYGCLFWYKMDEESGDTVIDHGKYKQHAQIHGATWVKDEEKDWVLEFDGIDDYVSIPDISHVAGYNWWTIDFEVKLITPHASTVGLFHSDIWRPLIYVSANNLQVYHANIEGTGNHYNTGVTFPDDQWVRVTFMGVAGIGFFLLFDGKIVSHSKSTDISGCGNWTYLELGRYSLSNYAKMRMRNVRMFGQMRWDIAYGVDQTPATVFAWDDNRFDKANYAVPDDSDLAAGWHFDEGSGSTAYDFSSNSKDLTLVNNCAFYDTSFRGEAGTSMDFPAGTDRCQKAAASLPFYKEGFTVEAWVDADVINGAATYYRLVNVDWGGANGSWLLSIYEDDIVFYGKDSTGTQRLILQTSAPVLTASKHYHIVVTTNGDYMDCYINGEEVVTYATQRDMSSDTYPVNNGTFEVGGSDFNGRIDEIRIHNRSMSASEIAARYRSEPFLHDFYQASRIYSKNRNWKGLPIISNGLVMLSFPDYDSYEYRNANSLVPMIYAWYNNSWHPLTWMSPYYRINEGATYIYHWDLSTFEIIELTDQSCTLRISHVISDRTYYPEGTIVHTYYTIRNGYPGVLMRTDDSDWIIDDDQGMFLMHGKDFGISTGYEVTYIAQSDTLYQPVTGSTGYTSPNVDDFWALMYPSSALSNAPSRDVILGMFVDSFFDDLSGTGNMWYFNDSADLNIVYCQGMKNGGIFYIPYDADKSWISGEDASLWTGETGTQAEPSWANMGNVVYKSPPAASMTAQLTLDKGDYVAVILWAGNGGVAKASFTTTGSVATQTLTDISVPDAGAFSQIYFTAKESDVITFQVTAVDWASINVGGIAVIPLTNSIDYANDLANQGLTNLKIKRGLKG
jgi:hypothetical protein